MKYSVSSPANQRRLFIQDTTDLDFTGTRSAGSLGCLNYNFMADQAESEAIMVADREADIHEILQSRQYASCHCLIHSCYNCKLDGQKAHLWVVDFKVSKRQPLPDVKRLWMALRKWHHIY